jgi:alkylhydroperoxidase/carboxymuconolactone decarboxylase family protein YurZ
MLGLVASMVLRCDDCIKYHLGKAHEQGMWKSNWLKMNIYFQAGWNLIT